MNDVRESESESVPPKTSQPPTTGRQRLRNRRTVALALSVILGSTLLIWGADWLARLGAQSLLASSIADYTGSRDAPRVHIGGNLFLTQVIRGRYDHVEVAMDSISDGPLRLESLTADLYDVHLPFHDILVGHSNSVLIDHTHEAALLRWEDLNSYLEFTGRTVRIEPSGDGQVLLTATTSVLGSTVSASAEAELSAEDGGIAIAPRRLQTQSPIDSASELLLGRRFTFIVPLDPLPFGQNITGIEVRDDGLLVQAEGTNVVVTP